MRKTVLFLLTLVLMLGAFSLANAITIEIGNTSTGTSFYLPIYTGHNFSYSQQIYLQNEINQAGAITKISFRFDGGGSANSNNWDIYMGHTSKSGFSSKTDWIPVANMTRVFRGNAFTGTLGQGWLDITLQTPFNYNNSDNLVIAVDENTSNSSSTGRWNTFNGSNCSIYCSTYLNNNIDPSNPSGTDSELLSVKNILKLEITPVGPADPIDFNASTHSDSQIDLSWYLNNVSNNILLAWNTTNDFGTPSGSYSAGDSIGDGTVLLVNSSNTSFNHTNLEPNTTYYYKIWSMDANGNYSNGVTASATTSDGHVPVELSSFTAAISVDNFVNLMWVTQSETGVLGFYVLRNTENHLGTALTVSELIPATNTSEQQSYIFKDSELYEDGLYYYWLQNSDMDGSMQFHGPASIQFSAIGNSVPEIPLVTQLKPIYPNPFNPMAYIPFSLKEAATVNFEIYNARGQLMKRIPLGQKAAGNHRIEWDGSDDQGHACGTGIYHIRMTAGNESFSRKAVLMK
jgi:hypothetical protein